MPDRKRITKQMQQVQDDISVTEKRLDTIERESRLKYLTEEERDTLEGEQKRLKNKLSGQDKDLRQLQKENFRTMIVSSILMGVLCIIYFYFWKS